MSVYDVIPPEKRLYENKYFYVVADKYPVSPGHLLIVSKLERRDYFDLSEAEQAELPWVIRKAKELIEGMVEKSAFEKMRKSDNDVSNVITQKPDGFNIGINCGEAAGQTIMHFHCHVIPRYKGDTPNPRGGVRHCIPGEGGY